MDEILDQELPAQMAQEEPSTKADVSVLRFHILYRLVLTGVLAIVGTIALIVVLLWVVPSDLPAAVTLEIAVAAICIIGTLVGVAVGYLLGSMGKERAEKRADKNLALLVEKLQKVKELNGAS